MIPLISIIKDPTGGWVALFFLLFFVVKVILALVGGDVDASGDLDFDGDGVPDADVNVDGFGFSASDFFSLKGFVNFGVGFSSSWALFGLEGWNAALFHYSRRSDPLCSRLSNLYDHKTGLESDLPSGLDRSRYHGHYDRDRRHREPDRCSIDGNCRHLKPLSN